MKFRLGDRVIYIEEHPDYPGSYLKIGMTGTVNKINEGDLQYNVKWDERHNVITHDDDLAGFEIRKMSKLEKALR